MSCISYSPRSARKGDYATQQRCMKLINWQNLQMLTMLWYYVTTCAGEEGGRNGQEGSTGRWKDASVHTLCKPQGETSA